MLTDVEIKVKGYEVLSKYWREVESEKFIALIQREAFDYTEWRKSNLPEGNSIEELSKKAMEYRKKPLDK